MEISQRQRELIRHCVGFDGRHKVTYRNHFVTGPGSDDYDDWMDLVNKGYAFRRAGNEISGGDDIFWVNLATALLVRNNDEHVSQDWRE